AEDFDADITAYARDQLVDTKLNGLRDFVAAAGNVAGRFRDGLDHLGFRLLRVGPLLARLQHDVAVRLGRRHWVGGDFRSPDPAEEVLYLRNPAHPSFERLLQFDRERKTGARNPDCSQRHVALVQARNELAAHAGGREAAGKDDDGRRYGDAPSVPDGATQQGPVNPFRAPHE